jgi:hypothetical protein
MESISYNRASATLLLTLLTEINRQPWLKHHPNGPPSTLYQFIVAALLDALTQLAEALDVRYQGAKEADIDWDDIQRMFAFLINRERRSRDPKRREAAELLHQAMLSGQGTAQTSMTYADEVTFGTKQVELAKQPLYQDALSLLNLQDHIPQIAATTAALKDAIGLDGSDNLPSRRTRQEQTHRRARLVTAWAHESLLVAASLAKTDQERDELNSLLAPFLAIQSKLS